MDNKSKKFDIFETTTSQIIEILNSHKTHNFSDNWFPIDGELFANNPISNRFYNGFNLIYLSFLKTKHGYSQNRWVTLNQANRAGGRIKKGEKANIVTYWTKVYLDGKSRKNITSEIKNIAKKGGKTPVGVITVPVCRYYNVFNLDQCEDMPEELFYKDEQRELDEPEKDERAENFLHKSGATIQYVKNHIPCYMHGKDIIVLPIRKQYKGKEHFYSDALHELGHWTGHPLRLDRLGDYNDKAYAFEELVAELFSAMSSAYLGFSSQITNNAAYINSWLNHLKDDKKFIYQASSKAQKALNFTLELIKTIVAETA